jgi:hypothetical protein
MNVEAPLETNAQFAEGGKPGMRALDHPAMPSEPLLAFHAATGDTCRYAALLQVTSSICVTAELTCPMPLLCILGCGCNLGHDEPNTFS